MTLVLTKGDTGEEVLEEIRELIGPASVDQAKEEAPDRYVRLGNPWKVETHRHSLLQHSCLVWKQYHDECSSCQ